MKNSTLSLVILVALAALALTLLDPTRWAHGPLGSGPEPASGEFEALPDDDVPALATSVPEVATTPLEAHERLAVDAAPFGGAAVFRLLDSEGRRVRHALVLAARDEGIVFQEYTDEHGEVSAESDGGDAQLVARASGHALHSWPVRLAAGLHELRYPELARVTGRVVLEDGAPAGGLRLSLRSDTPLLPEESIPPVVWTRLGLQPSQAVGLMTESREDGGFSLSGLPPDWSGSLRLPAGWRVRSASHGRVDASTERLRLDAPIEGLLLRLAAPATWRGRLLQRGTATPVTGVTISARASAPEQGSSQDVRVTTDDEGRFDFTSRHERLGSLELRLGSDDRANRLLLALEGAELPADGDLGDVFVDEGRDVPFLLRTSTGEPIRGGRALAAGLRSEPTGEDGRGVLRWIPVSTPRLRVEAAKFVPAEVELAPVVPDPLVIVLEPANELVVRLIPPAGGNPDSFRVVLRREEGLVAGPLRDEVDQRAYVGDWSYAPVDLAQASPATFLTARPSGSEGLARFHALRVGVEIELEVRGITGDAVYDRRTLEPFRAGESRRVDVLLGESIVVFRGRVLDAEGRPLSRAVVQLGGQILGWTDEHGAFLCFLVDPSPGTLVLQHPACSTSFLHDYAVPVGGGEVEFRLQPARTVTIEVADEAGQPVPQAEVWILQEGFTTNTHRLEGSRHLASSLTENPFEIQVRVGGRSYTQEHTSDVGEARVVVPVHGGVLVQVSAATTRDRAGYLSVVLVPAGGDGDEDPVVAGKRCESGDLDLELPAVLPGRYDAWLNYDPTDDERAAGCEDIVSATVSVLVEPARRTELSLDLP